MRLQISLGLMCVFSECVSFLIVLLFSGTAFHNKGITVILKIECLLETLVSIFYLIGGS